MFGPLLLAALLGSAPAPAPAPAAASAPADLRAGQDDEIVREFEKYFRKYKDTPTRVEAVMSLSGVESVGVVEVLVDVLGDSDRDVAEAAIQVLSEFTTPAPREAVVAALAESKKPAETVGLLRAVAAGGYPGADGVLAELVAADDWTVRMRAVDALARLAPAGAAEAVAGLVGDPEPAVRAASFAGLARLRAPAVVELGVAALEDPVWQVRAAAVQALGAVRSRDSIGPLIERMALEEGRLVADIGTALANITGRDFGTRTEQWQSFWETFRDRFQIPTDEEMVRLRKLQAERKQEYKPGDGTSYHGVVTPSRAIVFVIDVSGSMENLVVETERFEGGGYPSMLRIDIVKTELARTIESLEPYVEFNILAFATKVDRWKKGLVKANVLNKSSAGDWVRRLEAIGGASKQDLAQVGLVGSANLEAGKTNSYEALMEAIEAPRPGAKSDKDYEVAVDTVFFLSDGRPSTGLYIDPKDILREVRRANELRRIEIHTIAIGEFQKDFMRQLAEENGGVFVDLGR